MNGRSLVGLTAAVGFALVSQASFADGRWQPNGRYDTRYENGRYDNGRYAQDYDYARVVDVDPLVERYRVAAPVQECWNETRYEDARGNGGNRNGATLLGGLVGAVIGNQFGHGSDRKVATVAGAVLGGAVGNQVGRSNEGRYGDEAREYDVQRCATRHEDRYEERVVAYRVTYLYNGRRLQTELPYDPGPRMRIAVAVRPAE